LVMTKRKMSSDGNNLVYVIMMMSMTEIMEFIIKMIDKHDKENFFHQ